MGGYPRGFCQNTRQTPRETCWCGNRTAPGPTQSPSSGDRARSILATHEGAMTSTTITPIEIDGQFYVSVILDGHEKRYGPYSDTEAAETMAARFAGICRGVFHQQVAIGVVRQPAANRA